MLRCAYPYAPNADCDAFTSFQVHQACVHVRVYTNICMCIYIYMYACIPACTSGRQRCCHPMLPAMMHCRPLPLAASDGWRRRRCWRGRTGICAGGVTQTRHAGGRQAQLTCSTARQTLRLLSHGGGTAPICCRCDHKVIILAFVITIIITSSST